MKQILFFRKKIEILSKNPKKLMKIKGFNGYQRNVGEVETLERNLRKNRLQFQRNE